MNTIEKGKYTAGPWQWKNGKLLGDEGTPIRVDDPTSYSPYRIAQENGKLVSAAPELLEALKVVPLPKCNSQRLGNYDDYPSACDCGNCELRWQIEAAIAKAEGQP